MADTTATVRSVSDRQKGTSNKAGVSEREIERERKSDISSQR